MKNIRIKKAFVTAIALSGVILNAMYGASLLSKFFDPQSESAIREILISAIILEFSWALLLLWVAIKPFAGRHILLFTVIPVLSGNFMHSFSQHIDSTLSYGALVSNSIFGLFYAGLYVVAYHLVKTDAIKALPTEN